MPSRKSSDFSHRMDRLTQRPFRYFFECVVFLIVDIVFHYIFTHIAKRIPIVAGRLQMNIPIL